MEQLVLNNINKNLTLGNILKEYGVKFKEFKKYWIITEAEFINGGAFGKAFNIGNEKVLKITSDINEFNAMKKLIELNNSLNESDLYFKHYVSLPLIIFPINEDYYEYFDDESFNTNKKYVRYYYIMEKLYPLSDIENRIIIDILNILQIEGVEEIYYDEFTEFQENVLNNSNLLELYDINLINDILTFMFNCYELSFEHEFYDMNINNMMKDKNDKYKLIDLRIY